MSDYSHKYETAGTLPVLPVDDVASAAGFYTNTLGFEEQFRQQPPGGPVVNAQLQKGGCSIMLNHNPDDAHREGGGIYLWFRLTDQDIDAYYSELLKKGVEVIEEIKDQFWGDRSFAVRDCNGYALAFNKAIEQRA